VGDNKAKTLDRRKMRPMQIFSDQRRSLFGHSVLPVVLAGLEFDFYGATRPHKSCSKAPLRLGSKLPQKWQPHCKKYSWRPTSKITNTMHWTPILRLPQQQHACESQVPGI